MPGRVPRDQRRREHDDAYDALGRLTSETNVLGPLYPCLRRRHRLQLVTYPTGQTSSYAYYDSLGDERTADDPPP
jgi:hypothetical protein